MYNTFFQWVDGNIEDIDIVYMTAEMTVLEIIGEFQSFCYYRYRGKLTDIDQIYSNGENAITQELDEYLESDEMKDLLRKFQEKVTIIAEKITPKFIYKKIHELARKNGEIVENAKGEFISYNKTNPNKWCVFIFDNFQKIQPHAGQALRQAIVETSLFLDVYSRMRFGFVTVGIQQINRNSKSFDRYKLEQYFSSEQDLKDSEAPFHDCQIALTQISPYKLGLETFDGYKVKGEHGMMDRLRAIKIIKNRGGQAYKVGYFMFLGENSLYEELPYSEEMAISQYTQIRGLTKETNNERTGENI